MTIPSSGPVSMDTFSTEFAKQTGVKRSLSEFYGADIGVPASGIISFGDLRGKSAIKRYRYVRVEFSDVGPSGYANTAEIRVALNNTALNPTAFTTSSNWSGNTTAMAFDNNSNTYWLAGVQGNGQFITIGFNAISDFNKIWIMPGSAYHTNVNGIKVWGSNTNFNTGPWTLIKEFKGLAGAGWVGGQYRWFNL